MDHLVFDSPQAKEVENVFGNCDWIGFWNYLHDRSFCVGGPSKDVVVASN